MNLTDFDRWCRSILEIDALSDLDDSLNGIQVGRGDSAIRKVAFAVDACRISIDRARECGAHLLFVHHGMFWGKRERIDGFILERVRALAEADMALYACHLPLDKHPELGNNAVLSRMLKLGCREPFGAYHGTMLGFKGKFAEPISLDEAVQRVLPDGSAPRSLLAFGPREIRTAAVISGGAAFEASQAADQGVDLYVTGEPSHSIYRMVEERKLNVICAGHYATETWGVKAICEHLARETGLETVFIDLPTGL